MDINCQHSAISTISETTLGQRKIALEEKTSSINLKSKSKRLLTHCIMPENDENQDHETSQQQSDKINKIKYSNLITTGTFNQIYFLFKICRRYYKTTTAFKATNAYSLTIEQPERMSLTSLETITDTVLELMEACMNDIPDCEWLAQWQELAKRFAFQFNPAS
ncbi:unnamed protein product [Rotaria sordida]|uniref:Uncharacterized protein n=1 Tax=Rotaria sordida TaxID=392033 RepID=A0A819V360_9BILA|nr:unnamed protein product [Rotaria sordida]CAF4093295.1 unnamed protein product [Rotaria sordida]